MECAYYMRNGQCKFGSTCKFHHPQPSNMMVPLRGSAVYPPIHSPTTSQLSYPLSRASFIASPRWQSPSSYAPLVMQQGVVSVPGWNTYSVIFLISLFSLCLIVQYGFALSKWETGACSVPQSPYLFHIMNVFNWHGKLKSYVSLVVWTKCFPNLFLTEKVINREILFLDARSFQIVSSFRIKSEFARAWLFRVNWVQFYLLKTNPLLQ